LFYWGNEDAGGRKKKGVSGTPAIEQGGKNGENSWWDGTKGGSTKGQETFTREEKGRRRGKE